MLFSDNMLISDFNITDCTESITGDGDCCCNCKHRLLSVVNGFPLGYFCGVDLLEDTLMFISYDGHGMCEMHERD